MKRHFSVRISVIFILSLLPLTIISCNYVTSFFKNAEVGDVSQQVDEVFVVNPQGVKVDVWQQNLEAPWALVFLPNGDALVTERPGRIRLIQNGQLQATPYATIEAVSNRGEGGLMGMDLHPDFESNPYIYVYYTHRTDGTHDNRVIRLRHNETSGNFDKVILSGIPASANHNGGRIKFGPDGMLYITTGENFEQDPAQDMNSLAGKILRITPEGEIPPDNPFNNSMIYTLGHRNPQGLAWHPQTGDLFSSEHGPSGEMRLRGHDMVNIIYSGKNYGWPHVIGKVNNPKYEDPFIVWEETTPPSGMAFWNGDLYIAILRSQTLARIGISSRGSSYVHTRMEHWFASERGEGKYGRLRDAVVGPDGALYVLTSNRDGRGSPIEADDRILRITKTD